MECIMTKKALAVIDLQNDYFPKGEFPLWNTETTLTNIENAIALAKQQDMPVIIIQHIADNSLGIAPFFNPDTHGAEIHKDIITAATDCHVVVKAFADGFENTCLDEVLQEYKITDLLLCGMMTQNCVTHTALSKKAEKYKVSILTDCCTTVNEALHNIALHAVSTRVNLMVTEQALATS